MSRGAIILAGGKNSRMGTVKWLLSVGGETVLSRIVTTLRPHVEDLVIVLPYDAEKELWVRTKAVIGREEGIRLVQDLKPDVGPIEGLAAALPKSTCEFCLVAAADMPFIRWDVAETLFAECENKVADAAIPSFGGKLHPLFAVYRVKKALPALLTFHSGGGRKVRGWVDMLHPAIVQVEPTDSDALSWRAALFNMNTAAHYEQAQRFAAGESFDLLTSDD